LAGPADPGFAGASCRRRPPDTRRSGFVTVAKERAAIPAPKQEATVADIGIDCGVGGDIASILKAVRWRFTSLTQTHRALKLATYTVSRNAISKRSTRSLPRIAMVRAGAVRFTALLEHRLPFVSSMERTASEGHWAFED
jgi:hypothetical protein